MKKDNLDIRYIFRAKSRGIVELKKLAVSEKKSASQLIREAIEQIYGIEV